MTANSTIATALHATLKAAGLGYPIAWPGLSFDPPSTGPWLEVAFLPNRGVDDLLGNDGGVSPQGLYQVQCFSRPQSEIQLIAVAESVQAVFPKGTPIAGNARLTRAPYQGSLISMTDRMMIPVTMTYSE